MVRDSQTVQFPTYTTTVLNLGMQLPLVVAAFVVMELALRTVRGEVHNTGDVCDVTQDVSATVAMTFVAPTLFVLLTLPIWNQVGQHVRAWVWDPIQARSHQYIPDPNPVTRSSLTRLSAVRDSRTVPIREVMPQMQAKRTWLNSPSVIRRRNKCFRFYLAMAFYVHELPAQAAVLTLNALVSIGWVGVSADYMIIQNTSIFVGVAVFHMLKYTQDQTKFLSKMYKRAELVEARALYLREWTLPVLWGEMKRHIAESVPHCIANAEVLCVAMIVQMAWMSRFLSPVESITYAEKIVAVIPFFALRAVFKPFINMINAMITGQDIRETYGHKVIDSTDLHANLLSRTYFHGFRRSSEGDSRKDVQSPSPDRFSPDE